ncbi:MAG: EcsC family protein [Janthinobacterium lividum]
MTEAQTKDDDGSTLLSIVQAIAISPAKATKIVNQYKKAGRKTNPKVTDEELERIVSNKIINTYSTYASLSGGITALPGIIPGVGTIMAAVGGGTADLTACMKIQIDMTMLLATNFGWDLTDHDAMFMTMLIAVSGGLEKLGVQTGAPVASKAGVKMLQMYLQGAALIAVKEFFKKFGITFTRKALEKSIPFGVGVVAGSGLNYALTDYVGNQAVKCFTIERKMRQEPDEEDEDTTASDEPQTTEVITPSDNGPQADAAHDTHEAVTS